MTKSIKDKKEKKYLQTMRRVNLSLELHAELKAYAARTNTFLGELVEEAVREYLDKLQNKRV